MIMAKFLLSFMLIAEVFAAGGISGGGGNSLPLNPKTPQELNDLVGNSRMQLSLFLNYLDNHREELPEELKPLIDNNMNLINQVRWHVVIPEDNGPCYDRTGRATDGSIVTKEGRGICISTYNLSKIDGESAPLQMIALMGHEYAHLAGADEALAEFVQRFILNHLKVLPAQVASHFTASLLQPILQTSLTAHSLIQNIPTSTWQSICQQTEKMNEHYESVVFKATVGNAGLYTLEHKRLINTVRWQLANIVIGSCLMAQTKAAPVTEWTMYKRQYELMMEQYKTVSLSVFFSYISPQAKWEAHNENFSMTLISDKESLLKEVSRTYRFFKYVEDGYYAPLRNQERNF